MEANNENMTKERYLNPFTDFGFKKLFGTEANKDVLLDFLNQVLPLDSPITDLQYKKTEHLGHTDLDRKVIYDLYCENAKGEKFIVELQKAKQIFFKDRALFYSTFPIQEQAQRGDWNYELQSVYTVAILDFRFDETNKKDVKHLVKLVDVYKNEVFYHKLTFLYIQMPNFQKKEEELVTMEDKWLYLLKNLSSFTDRPAWVQERIFDKIFQVAEVAKFTPEERTAYEDSIKYYRDVKNSIDTAHIEGKEEAMLELMPLIEEANRQKEEERRQKEEERRQKEEERRQKEEERRQKEEAQKREEALRQSLLTTAKALLSKGFSIEEVANMTNLSVEEVKAIGA